MFMQLMAFSEGTGELASGKDPGTGLAMEEREFCPEVIALQESEDRAQKSPKLGSGQGSIARISGLALT